MDCVAFRELAGVPTNEGSGPEAELSEHLGSCVPCQRWRARSAALDDRLRAASTAVGPDFVAPVLSAWRSGDLPPRHVISARMVRVVLGLVGLLQVAAGVVPIATNQAHGVGDAAALGAAVGVGFIIAALQPRLRLAGLVPVVAAATLLVGIHIGLDLASGNVGLSEEANHLPTILGILTLGAVRILEMKRRIRLSDGWRRNSD